MKRFLVFLFAMIGANRPLWAQGQQTAFSAMGDVPYSSGEYSTLQQQMLDHNKYSPAKFQVHVGDIKSGSGSCSQAIFSDVANILKMSVAPFYIIPGDNETTDCSNPSQAMGYWYQYFTNFEQNFCGSPYTEHQSGTPENFAFVLDGVLYLGINLVGGGGASTSIQQIDAEWVDFHFTTKKPQVRAAVVFSQAGPGSGRDAFFDSFVQSAGAFGKPVLFLHGDGHSWIQNNPWSLSNTMRIEVEQGGSEDPVEITVSMNTATPSTTFLVKRNPWSSNTIVNMPPCANAGPDQTVATTSANLSGSAVDDGDPSSGSLTKTWSKVSGPGTVTFGNASSLTTSASFSLPGVYVLRLTANDSQLQGSDDVTITVEGSATPVLTINDISLNEGNSGTANADFTVSLAAADGSTVTVDYQIVDGTATNGDDYTASASSGTLTFSGAATSQTITVAINGDAIDEMQDETFFVNLSNATNATIADVQGQGTIVNDDAPVPPAAPANLIAKTTGTTTVDLTWSDQSNSEDGFKIERKTGSDSFAEIATVGADATSYIDAGLNASTVYTYQVRAFAASTSSAYSNMSATETGSGTVANPGTNIALNKTATASSTDASYPTTKAFDGNTTSSYWRTLSINSSNLTQWLRVDLGVVQTVGRAVIRWNGSYFAKSYELQVSNNDVDWTTVYSTTSGVAGNADFSFTPALARYVRVYMTLNNGSTYRIYEFEVYSGPNAPPLPTLAINDVSVNEGNSGTTNAVFTVSLTGVPQGGIGTATVNYQTGDGTATSSDDYVTASGTLTFSGATTTQTITVAINGDANDEMQDETFFVNLSNATNATITDAQGQGTIVNDDAPVPPAAPANLKAKTTGTSTVDLTWSDQSNNEDGFKIERKIPQSGTFSEIGTMGADATSYNDSGLNASTVYTYQVRAFKASTGSAYSNMSATEIGSGVVASPGVNIALNKASSASSSDPSYLTPKAFDGSTSSYWRTVSINSGNVTQWLRVDLGVVQTVGRAVIRWNGSYFAKSYELQVSNNDVDWTTVYSTTGGVAGNADFSFTPALARYVRVYMTLNNGSTYRIYEFEVYSGPILPTLAINDVSMNEGNSGTTDAVFTVSLTGVPQGGMGTATVNFQTGDDTAIGGDDYVTNSGTLTFSGATTTQTIIVAINGDMNDEAQDETFFVNLSNATNAAITDAQGQGTIVNDDAPVPPSAPANLKAKTTGTSTVDLTWSDQSNNEDGFKIERKTGSGVFAEIASPGADVVLFNDTGLDPSTVYTYQVRAFTSSTSSAYSNMSATETGSGTVANPGVNIALNKAATASSTDASYPTTKAFDGNITSSYWRTLSINSSNLTQWLRVDLGVVQTVGRAVIRWNGSYFAKSYELQVSNNDVDWATVYSTTSGVVGNADFSFTPTLARYVRVYMTLNNGSTYRIYEFEIYSGPILPALAINDVSMNEGNSGTTDAVFTVSLTGVPQGGIGTATVNYQTGDGTATGGDDYVTASGTLTFSGATTTQTITVAINGDATDEAQDETFFVNLSNATNAAITDAQGQGTIVNDDAPVPPSAPTNLAANATSSSDIALTWQDNSSDETGFKIERKTGSDSFAEIMTVSADATSYNDTGLNSNTTYVYRVRASNSNGDSGYSNEASATTHGSTPANLALNKPTTALSTYSSKPTTNAVDGDANTYWRSGSLASPPLGWLRVDLGGALMVARVVINWRDDYYAKTYEVQVSSDDVVWTPVASGSGAVGIQTLIFTATTARYVRLNMTLNNRSSYRVAELEVYSSSGATTKRNANESEVAKSEVVTDYVLEQNYPNSFNPNTQIRFGLPEETHVTIKVYALNGAEVRTLVDDRYTAGTHTVTFNAGNLPSGAYFYVMQAGNVRQVRRLMLVK